MRADQPNHEGIEPAHDFARGRFIVLASRRDEGGRIEIISHVIQDVSTLTGMTGVCSPRLQDSYVRGGKAFRSKL